MKAIIFVFFIVWRKSFCELSCKAPDVKNARIEPEIMGLDYTVGMDINIVCLPGFHFKHIRHFYFVCMDDGQWDSEFPICEDVTCNFPNKPKNGQVFLTNKSLREPYPFGSGVIYQCDPYYVLEGPVYRSCETSGWSNKDPYCKAIECKGFPKIENGYVSAAKYNIFPEEEVPIQCDLGFKPAKGTKAFLTCTTVGQWDTSNSYCSAILCDPPLEPEHGSFKLEESGTEKKSVYEFADQISYYCDHGYSLDSNKVHTCTENGWSDSPPKCEAVSCPSPPVPSNGWIRQDTLKEDNYEDGNLVVYQCREGYKLFGSADRMCTERGWDGVPARCETARCPFPPVPSNGWIRQDTLKENYEVSNLVVYQCREGYKLIGNAERMCTKRGWDGVPAHCIKNVCHMPEQVTNGWIVGVSPDRPTQYLLRTRILYNCDQGYTLIGEQIRTCTATGWSGTSPICQENGKWTEWSSWSACSATCGMAVKTRSRTCGNPAFSGIVCVGPVRDEVYCLNNPPCPGNYCTKPQISNTEPIGGHFRYQPTKRVTMQCIAGYKLVSDSELECQEDGTWKPSTVICQEILCAPPSAILFGKIVPVKKYYKYGDTIQYRCNYIHLALNGRKEHKCTENGWDGDTPSCIVKKKHNITCSCPKDLSVKVHRTCGSESMFQVGDSISLGFDSTNDSSEVSEVICSPNGTWFTQSVNQSYTKAKICPTPPPIRNARLFEIETSYHIGTTAYIICDDGFRLFSGPDYLTCQPDGTWNNRFAQCEPAWCKSPISLANGSVENLVGLYEANYSWPFGSEVHFRCNPGFQLHGHHWLKCMENGWSGSLPICKKISCVDPDTPEEGRKLVESLYIGSKSLFGCFSGYHLIGSKERICLNNGQWSGIQPRCETGRTDCPVLSAPENGVKTGSRYNEDDAVSFACNSNFVLVGSKRRICINGLWTGSDSNCIGKDQFNVQEEISRNMQLFLTELLNKQRRIIKQKNIQEDLGLQKMAVKVPKLIILYIILDASSNIGHINFQRQKDFSRALIQKLDISQSGTRVGVITFSSRATAEFYPNDFHSKHNILDALNKTTCKTNGASLQSALEILGDMIEETNDALTEGLAENYVFILTDGKAKGGLNPLGVAKRLKERHAVHFTCISLTGQARKDILYGIASDHNHAYFLDSYSTMDWLTDQINRGTLDYSKCGHLPSSTDLRSFKEDVIYPWPWTVLISYGGQQKCKGSLISHKWVLTSGSCVDRTGLINPKDLSLELELSKKKLQVETIHVHPEYYFKTSSMSNNAALILLKDGMGFTNEIRPICLPSSVDGGTLYKPGEYGHERFLNGKQSSLIIMNKSTCKAALLGEELSDNTFCAQHTEDHDANNYNQGGSLNKYHSVSDGEPVWIQIGITSYYQGNLFKYFTNVLNIKDWITAFVKN